MAKFHARRIKRDRVLWKLRRRREDELSLGINEPFYQPRRRDAVDVRSWARHPSAPLELREIEGRPVLTAYRFRTSRPHSDDLLETPHLRASGGTEEIDVTDALVVFDKPSQLLLHPRALRR